MAEKKDNQDRKMARTGKIMQETGSSADRVTGEEMYQIGKSNRRIYNRRMRRSGDRDRR